MSQHTQQKKNNQRVRIKHVCTIINNFDFCSVEKNTNVTVTYILMLYTARERHIENRRSEWKILYKKDKMLNAHLQSTIRSGKYGMVSCILFCISLTLPETIPSFTQCHKIKLSYADRNFSRREIYLKLKAAFIWCFLWPDHIALESS